MDTLPLELHAQIFECACVDDGTTARSLALVSHYVRDVSEPFRYQSLAVAGLASLTQLAHTLEGLPAHRRRARHLFLSDWTHTQAHAKSTPSDDAAMERYDREHAAVLRVLDLVAPTLETCAVVAACPFTSTALLGGLFRLRLPRLRDLAVHGFYPFPHRPHAMPALERLHLSGNRNPHGLLQSRGLNAACARLRELRVSGLVSAPAFADELQSALLVEGSHGDDTFPPTLPPSLRKITVDVGPAPSSSRRYAASFAQHEKMLDVLRSVEGRDGDAKGVEVHIAEIATGVHPYELLKSQCSRRA